MLAHSGLGWQIRDVAATGNLGGAPGYLVQSDQRSHWWALANYHGRWFVLDSLSPGPVPIGSPSEYRSKHRDCRFFVVEGLERCSDVLPGIASSAGPGGVVLSLADDLEGAGGPPTDLKKGAAKPKKKAAAKKGAARAMPKKKAAMRRGAARAKSDPRTERVSLLGADLEGDLVESEPEEAAADEESSVEAEPEAKKGLAAVSGATICAHFLQICAAASPKRGLASSLLG